MIIWDCADGFVAEIQSDEDFDNFLRAFTANDDVKHHADEYDEYGNYRGYHNCDDFEAIYDDDDDNYDVVDDWDDDCDYDCGYDPYLGCFTDDC